MQPYQLYGMGSPNVVKVAITLEEFGQPYDLHWVNVFKGEQHESWFRALNPNGKVPVLLEPRDNSDFVLFESGAIMEYLADKHGGFAGTAPDERAIVRQWLIFQMAGLGPNFGQGIHFSFVSKAGSVLTAVQASLHSELEGRVPFGSNSALVTQLFR